MKKTLMKLLLAIMLATTSVKAKAQIDGDIEYIHSEFNKNSYPRTNFFYELPGDTKGFTYLEFYKDDKGYFGKTSLEKKIDYGINSKVQIIHLNEPFNHIGFGFSAGITYPKKGIAKISFMPKWYNNHGKKKKKIILGYYGSIDLFKGFNITSFGEWNIYDKPKWTYGEISLSKKIGDITISYNPSLRGKGDAVPNLEHRISAKIDF